MTNILNSKSTAWLAMILAVALIVMAFIMHTPWWGFIAIFLLFVGIFAHLISLYLGKINKIVGRKLEMCAFVLVLLAVIGFIVEYILFNIGFGL